MGLTTGDPKNCRELGTEAVRELKRTNTDMLLLDTMRL